jgi:hypothetical protein
LIAISICVVVCVLGHGQNTKRCRG